MKRFVLALAGVAAFVAAYASLAAASPIFGVAEDASKYAEDGGASIYNDLEQLGMSENRWTLLWNPANPTAIGESAFLDRATPVAARAGIDIVLSVYQTTAAAPDPAAFCAWVASVARRYPTIKKFIIGNEVNATRFWSPQHTADNPDAGPQSYYDVLSQCYDALKAVNADIQVIGMGLAPRAVDSNSTKPLDFIRAVGRIYKASGRTKPIMDLLAIHPYPNPNANPQPSPDNGGYEDPGYYGVNQLDRVKQAIYDAFNGTGQPTTLNGLKLKIDEYGYQAAIPAQFASLYTGTEASPVVDEATQAAYHALAITKYLICDPAVSEVLFFHLIDETDLGRFQSGMERADRSHRAAFDAIKAAIAAGCTGPQISWTPTTTAGGGGPAAGGGTTASGAKRVADLAVTTGRYAGVTRSSRTVGTRITVTNRGSRAADPSASLVIAWTVSPAGSVLRGVQLVLLTGVSESTRQACPLVSKPNAHFSCKLRRIAAGKSVSYVLRWASVRQPGSVTVSAAASRGSDGDPLGDNTASATTELSG